jgi:O-methyltransferase
MNSTEIETRYRIACTNPSDINEHVHILREYAGKCDSVCEFGVRGGVSTWGFLAGLADSAASKKTQVFLTGYDLDSAPPVYLHDANDAGIEVKFHQKNVLHAQPVSCDLLFIDTFHVYGQLRRELELHATGVRKYIILHDTTVDEYEGEVRRMNFNAVALSATTKIPCGELLIGLWPAVELFLATRKEWMVDRRLTNNNGLTVLCKKMDVITAALGCSPVLVECAADLYEVPLEAKYAFSYNQLTLSAHNVWKCIRTYSIGCVYARNCEDFLKLPCGINAANTWLTPDMYIEYAARVVAGFVTSEERASFVSGTYTFDEVQRVVSKSIGVLDEKGHTWGFENLLKLTMIGLMRLRGLGQHLLHVNTHGIPGDLLETGVWKGGACIFMALCLRDIGNPYNRRVIGCDSFAGLPPPNATDFPADAGDLHYTHNCLAIPQDVVQSNVLSLGLSETAITWVKGWFKDTLQELRSKGISLAVLRLDGDMYESTIQALTSLEPTVQDGGIVVIDDYGLPGAKKATHDYIDLKKITSVLISYGDDMAVYWIKA